MILAVLAGAELDGVAGMFLAVPAVAIASVVYRHWLAWRSADGDADIEDAPAAAARTDTPQDRKTGLPKAAASF